ncbi:MAG: DMT family transporter [Pikeienuella sp.]
MGGSHNLREKRARLAAVVGGAVWGAVWVPVRWLEEAGLPGLWPVAVLYGLGAIGLLPLAVTRFGALVAGGWRLHLTGLCLGGTMALYAAAFLYTEVVPAVLLYYLSPVWGFLVARLVAGDLMTPARWIALVLALAGAAFALGPDNWPPMPRNIGDWMALSSGLLWVIGSMVMLSRPAGTSLDYGIVFFVWGALAIALAAWIFDPGPAPDQLRAELPWLLPLVFLLILPGCLAAIHGAASLNPGLVGILFMTEIGVSLALAWLLTDERIGGAQLLGVLLISLAGAADGIWRRVRAR